MDSHSSTENVTWIFFNESHDRPPRGGLGQNVTTLQGVELTCITKDRYDTPQVYLTSVKLLSMVSEAKGLLFLVECHALRCVVALRKKWLALSRRRPRCRGHMTNWLLRLNCLLAWTSSLTRSTILSWIGTSPSSSWWLIWEETINNIHLSRALANTCYNIVLLDILTRCSPNVCIKVLLNLILINVVYSTFLNLSEYL